MCTRAKVGAWAMDTSMRTELILEALQSAVTQGQPRGVIHYLYCNIRVTCSANDAKRRA